MAKRANGEGSYIHIKPVKCESCPDRLRCDKKDDYTVKCSKRDKQERWCFQYTVKTADGNSKTRYMYSKKKARLVARVERMQAESGQDYRQSITLGGWLDIWADRYLSDTVQQATAEFYHNMLKYVPQSLRNKQLSTITPVMLQMFFSDLLLNGSLKDGNPLSVTTVRSVRTTLGTALETALDNGFLIKNPIKKTKAPVSEQKNEMVYLNQEEMQRLLEVAESGEYYADYSKATQDIGHKYLINCYSMAVRLTLASGMRWGECFGLAWSDVNFNKRTIFIHNSLQDGILKHPKTTYSIRTITIDPGTLRKLREWQMNQKSYAQIIGDMYSNDTGLLFTNINGGPVNYDNFRIRCFNRMVLKAMLPVKTTFHSLRHSHATALLQNNVNVKLISERLGHSSVAFTLRVYTHVMATMDQSASDTIGAILANKKK